MWVLKFQTDMQLSNQPGKEQIRVVVMDMTTLVASNISRNITNSEKWECRKTKKKNPN